MVRNSALAERFDHSGFLACLSGQSNTQCTQLARLNSGFAHIAALVHQAAGAVLQSGAIGRRGRPGNATGRPDQ